MHRAAIVIQSFFKMIVQRKQYLSIQNFMLNLQSRNRAIVNGECIKF
ncbi:hypothetical protein T03_5883 [Trichinella britovi]|uniref:Uncharacterized protein n=1 Tax=Trichinella britovi TaxID=45882 RepID=A0A0V0YU70_TRIBR|nr:hypothetical protein T03_5883 [Trichinella britovi]